MEFTCEPIEVEPRNGFRCYRPGRPKAHTTVLGVRIRIVPLRLAKWLAKR